jgi:putative hemolysin
LGAPIPHGRIERLRADEDLTCYLRVRTDALDAGPTHVAVPGAAAAPAAIAPAVPPTRIADEVAGLPPSHALAHAGATTVYVGRADALPATMAEIGRLREMAFRAAGEGSGLSRDLDGFDEHYLHLFAWNHERREIVGAYRMGPTDEIVPRHGIEGLYTSTLFRYDERLLGEIAPALELGRAFVRAEYQREYGSLLLLWKGIATFVCRNPRYRMLFGPVSISNVYRSLSREILARFLYATSHRPELARLVIARNPPAFLERGGRGTEILGTVARTVAEVGALVAEIEADQKGVPVLLRQYLKLNARLLGFSTDAAFGNVLDGLVVVDLDDVDLPILARYMGRDEAGAFRATATR